MSKITDALHRAEEQRRAQAAPETPLFRRIQPAAPTPQDKANAHLGAPAPSARQASVSWSGGGPAVAPAPDIAPPAASRPTPAGQHVPSDGAGTVASWDAAIERVTQQLAAIETRVARGAGERVRLTAQLQANEQLVAAIGREQIELKQQLASVEQAMRAVDADRAAYVRQLDSLRECQVLSHTVRVMEQELAANAKALEAIARTQQHVYQEQEHYQQRAQALAQQLEGLRFRLAQALAFTGTTDARSANGGGR